MEEGRDSETGNTENKYDVTSEIGKLITAIKKAYPLAQYRVQGMQVRKALRSVGSARDKAEDSASTNGEP